MVFEPTLNKFTYIVRDAFMQDHIDSIRIIHIKQMHLLMKPVNMGTF